MTLRFGLACVGFLGACSLVFVGCGDDDATDNGGSSKGGKGGTGGTAARGGSTSAGEGGEGATGRGGTAGASGRGGTAGDGGTSGSGGRGGTSGAGGTTGTGGSDATGGMAGDAGGGPLGGEGGDGGIGGAGGAGGDAGDAGAGGVPDTTADQCKYECADDDDCARGLDTSFECHPTRKRCENPDLVCDSHDDCVAMASIWTVACADDSGCEPLFGEVCVDVGGRGRCAVTPDTTLGCFLGGAETTFPKFGSSGDAVVCASDAGRCDDRGGCFIGCTESPCGAGLACNPATGLCECDADSECSITLGVSRCNMTTHLCECQSNTDCTLSGTNECVNGRCGCASASVCSTTAFPNATPVCE